MIDFGKNITECQENLKIIEGKGLFRFSVNDVSDSPVFGRDKPCLV